MNQALDQLADAIEQALSEVAAGMEMALIPEQAERHWVEARNHFLRCVEVTNDQLERTRERTRRER